MADDLSQRSVLILTSLAGGPRHGYGLIKDVEQFAGVRLGPGTLYGVLARLEQAGLVKGLPSEGRRYPSQALSATCPGAVRR
jgi:DNA-binding PadR family transcriptional regulator